MMKIKRSQASCVSKLTIIGILLIGPLGTKFCEILITINTFSFMKMHLKMSSAKWQPFCLSLNVFKMLINQLACILIRSGFLLQNGVNKILLVLSRGYWVIKHIWAALFRNPWYLRHLHKDIKVWVANRTGKPHAKFTPDLWYNTCMRCTWVANCWHYNDITWVALSQWSPTTWLFVQQLVQAYINENWSSVSGIHQWLVVSLTKCQHVLKSSCIICQLVWNLKIF